MRVFLFLICLLTFSQGFSKRIHLSNFDTKLVNSVHKIDIKGYKEAFNPSICTFRNGYLLIFRVVPNHRIVLHSKIGVVLLDQEFNPISEPVLLNTRGEDAKVISQSEDARLLDHQGRYYLVYNDNKEVMTHSLKHRRDIFVAELVIEDEEFRLLPPIKLMHDRHHLTRTWEKNWSPFIWNDLFLLIYSIQPHEIIFPNFQTGWAQTVYESTTDDIDWRWGPIRGGTPARLVNGDYLSFFHSVAPFQSEVTRASDKLHYFMGAYTFSSEPPFRITAISPHPINHETFYTDSDAPKLVIYPGGFVDEEDRFVVTYGKDDREVWIALINKDSLYNSLVPVEP